MAMARMPLPQPTSTALAVSAGSSVASSSRQPRVVACVPVPKARPASMRKRQQAGRHALGDVRGMDPERPDGEGPERALVLRHPVDVGQAPPTPSRLGDAERLRRRFDRASTRAALPSPKTSMRQGPSRETSRLVTMNPSSASRSSSSASQARALRRRGDEACLSAAGLMPAGRACVPAAGPRRPCRPRCAARRRTGRASRPGSRCRRSARRSARWRPGIRDA